MLQKINSMTLKRLEYKAVISIENLEQGLLRTKSNVSSGLDGETKAEFTQNKLVQLHKELKQQKYVPKPNRRVVLSKPNGGKRYLGIASQRDKIVQAALLIQLEQLVDGHFSENSFGFRPGRGCHDALHVIKYKWQNATWVINLDIQKYFDTIHHDILLEKLSSLADQATVELVRKLIKVGYVDIHNLNDRTAYSTEGVPQGSLISPILANIYLHDFDVFVQVELLSKWNRGNERKFVTGYQNRKALTKDDRVILDKYPELENQIERIKHNRWVLDGKPSRDPHDPAFRRLHYNRYADDFLFAFCGTKHEAKQIKEELEQFLLSELQLGINSEKSYIAHAEDHNILFLGMFIKYASYNKIVKDENHIVKGEVHQLKSTAINSAQLRVPVERLLKRAVEKQYAKQKPNGTVRATSCRKLASLSEKELVIRFSSIIRGILKYYSCVNQRSDLWPVVSLYRKSCALTLADKLKMRTAAQVFKKFGPKLKIKDELQKTTAELFYPDSLKTKIDFKKGKADINEQNLCIGVDKLQGSYKSNLKTALVCQYTGCNETQNLEVHHLNPQFNLNLQTNLTAFEKSLIAKKRKTIILCREHHLLAHSKKLVDQD
jgi:group II intron reverse transcriptase/maturase